MGGEEGILSMALNIHFSCKDPSGWHSCAKNSKISVSDDSAVIRREVRLLRQPNWIATPLFDLIRSGQVKLIKNMPRPEEGIVPLIDVRAYRELAPYSKRQRIGERADRRFDPKALRQDLWSRIGISTLSLPSYLRQGAMAR